ncbi:extracellular solute-binding protein [Natronoglycomyces albus]|uniref:Extracellular solute-binding protein n=1 Tax=Natronoglycomyces albus TaxID=2811108 RepID=A0A895XR25_9ACTN|nr:extracellular solute-binding protein [Natronoglycomyces albus]QSB05973.1 extracellular solute-binding protein [Natronoglycomyces albus]
MRRTRSIVAATAAATLLGTMAACGSDSERADDGEIEVWIAFTDYRLDWAEAVAEEFEAKHDDLSINVRGFESYEVLFDSMSNAVAQGNPPAIVQYFEAATQDARDEVDEDGDPMFVAIEEAIDGRTEILGEPVVLDDVVDAARNYYSVDGVFESMPWNTSTPLFYSNTDVMDEAGIDSPPETWQELSEACELIDALEDGPRYCVTWPNHGWFVEQAIAMQGGLLADNDNGRTARAESVNLTSPEMLNYLEWIRELAVDGHFYYSGVQDDWDGPRNAFIAEQTAFTMTSSGDATLVVNDGTDAGFDVEVSRMPYNGDVDYAGNLIGGATLWLTSGLGENTQDGALAFLQFLNNPENAADWHRATGYIPITYASEQLLQEEGWFDEHPYHAVANEQLDAADDSYASAGALVGGFVGIRAEVTQAVEDILVSEAFPEERMDEAQVDAQHILDQYNLLYDFD